MKLLIISDIHANTQALKTLLEKIHNYDELIFLGDIVDYGPSPAEAIDIIRGLDPILVKGNHDEAVAYNIDCRCGEELHTLSVYTRLNISLKQLSETDKQYLRKLPTHRELEVDNLKIYMVHASPADPLYDYIYPWTPRNIIIKKLIKKTPMGIPMNLDYDILLYGHIHQQTYLNLNGTKIINPGSVGQPRDHDWRAAAAVIDTDKEQITFIRVSYNVEEVLRRLKILVGHGSEYQILKNILLTGTMP